MNNADRLETLRESFKDAQTVKSNLEDVLNERRQIRREMEKMAEVESDALKQAEALYAKKLELQKVAQHKMCESQALLDSLEAEVKQKKGQLCKIDEQIHAEKEEMVKDIHTFEDLLSTLASAMVEAKTFYTAENLQKALTEIQMEYENLLADYKRLSEEELMLNSYIEDIDKRVDKYMAPGSLDREMIWRMFEEDKQRTFETLEKLSKQANVCQ